MVIAQKGIDTSIYARDQVTAFYLAQEAIEYVRNVRDTNRIAGYSGGWLWEFGATGANCLDTTGQKCLIDATVQPYFKSPSAAPGAGIGTSVLNACSGGICPAINFNPLSYFYGYSTGGSWTTTQFTRTVDIKEIVSGVEAVVTVTITWQTNIFSPQETFTVAEHVFAF